MNLVHISTAYEIWIWFTYIYVCMATSNKTFMRIFIAKTQAPLGLNVESALWHLYVGYDIQIDWLCDCWFLYDLEALIVFYSSYLIHVLFILFIYLFALCYHCFCLFILLILLFVKVVVACSFLHSFWFFYVFYFFAFLPLFIRILLFICYHLYLLYLSYSSYCHRYLYDLALVLLALTVSSISL